MTEHLSPPYADLLKRCATCGGPMPCALHDAALREAILHPPETFPWHALVRTELGDIGHEVYAMHALPDGTVLIGSIEGHVLRRSLQEKDARVEVVGSIDTRDTVRAFRTLPDGTILGGTWDGWIFSIDLSNLRGRRIQEVAYFEGEAYAFSARSDGTFVFVAPEGRILQFDPSAYPGRHPGFHDDESSVELDERFEQLGRYGTTVTALQPLGESGAFLIGGDDGNIVRFDPSRPASEHMQVLTNYGEAIEVIEPFTNGTFLVSGEGGRIVLFDPQQPEDMRLQEVAAHGKGVRAMTAISDYAFLVGDAASSLTRYEIPEHAIRAWHERRIDAPEVPPMPEA